MWDSLSIVWKACFEEAWAAYVTGSVPIGAVVTDLEGTIIARDRNRVLETRDSSVTTCRAPLAHAELNALLGLDFSVTKPRGCVIYSTLEPCPLCIGAIAVAGIKDLVYAASDPCGGSAALLRRSHYLRQKHITVREPSDRSLEIVSLLLVAQFYLPTASHEDTGFLLSLKRTMPDVMRQAQLLLGAGLLPSMARAGDSIKAVVEILASRYIPIDARHQ